MMIRKKLAAAVLSVLSVVALNADLQAEAANDNTLKVTDVVIEGVEGYGARINAQYTNDNLTALEQLGGGGVNSVRGFREHVASGDKGILGSLEIYTPEFAKNHRFLLFTDMARLSNNEYNVGERSRTLSSWGIGYRFLGQQDCGVNVSLDYAMSMSDGGLDMGKNNRRWNLIVSCQF